MWRALTLRNCFVFLLMLVLWGCGGDSGGGQGGTPTDPGADAGSDATTLADMGTVDPDQGEFIMRCINDEMCPEDQYCRLAEDRTQSVCAFGCREGNCGAGQICEDERRVCVRDPRCSTDDDCFGGEYCDDGTCADGCRVGNADDCPYDELGRPRTCDPATHTCELQVVCCDALDQCSLELPNNCDSPLLDERGCFNPNPCTLRCMDDADCESGLYCGEDNRCTQGCRTSGQSGCRDERICDPESRECVRPPCAIDTDCEDAFFCDGIVCLPGCRLEPDNCDRGDYCDERRRCVSDDVPRDCVDDAECQDANGAGWFCDGTDCQPPCAGHDDCPADEACIDGRCAVGCRDDDWEPNDDQARARVLNFDGNTYSSAGTPLFACSRNSDWFTFETPTEGMTIDISVQFVHAAGNLDMRLYGPDGQLLETVNSRDDNESVRLASSAGNVVLQGRYWLEIYGRGFDENDYSFDVTLLRGLGPDDAEPDNDSASATNLALPNVEQSETIGDRTIHPADQDWFSVEMGQRDGITVRLEMLGNDVGRDSELEFALFGPGLPDAGQGPIEAGVTDVGDPYVEFTARQFNFLIQDGRYDIRVRGVNEDQVGRYRLFVGVSRQNILCIDDVAEPNNVGESSFNLMDRDGFVFNGFDGQRELIPAQDLRLANLTLCDDDDDWYQITLRENDDFEARLERLEDNQRGDTEVTIYNANGNELASGLSGERNNVARIEGALAGTYRIRLRSIGMTRTAYDLVLFRTAGPIVCGDDRYDAAGANNEQGQASLVALGRHRDLSLCGADGDEDWYRFVVVGDGVSTLTAELTFAHAQGDLDLDVYAEGDVEPLNAGIRAGHSDTDDELVRLENRGPGTYYLRVRSVGAANVRYSMNVTVEAAELVCQDDPDEPNNAFVGATELGNGLVDREDQWICERRPVDDDTFYFVVPAGAARTVSTTFLFGDDGDLFLQLFNADEMVLASTADIQRGNSKQCIIIPAANVARGFFVRAVPLAINRIQQDDERLDYRLRLIDGEDCEVIPPETPGVNWPVAVDE
ncbi:MAG: hypothetical protein CMH52_08415 [Myxococcales bacterium]|nr:hypothetical protein [Myxococcales bacterium]